MRAFFMRRLCVAPTILALSLLASTVNAQSSVPETLSAWASVVQFVQPNTFFSYEVYVKDRDTNILNQLFFDPKAQCDYGGVQSMAGGTYDIICQGGPDPYWTYVMSGTSVNAPGRKYDSYRGCDQVGEGELFACHDMNIVMFTKVVFVNP